MQHHIDLFSIQTPEHLREGLEHQTRFDGGLFDVLIFETFQSSTKVQIRYEGLTISSMIRGYKTVYNRKGEAFRFMPGSSLILPEGETIFADFPEADAKNPVQCATILIPKETVEQLLQDMKTQYPQQHWELDFDHDHFHNNAGLVRAINELLQIASEEKLNVALSELFLKTLLIRVINAQSDSVQAQNPAGMNNQLMLLKKYIKEHLDSDLRMEVLMKVGNCSKSTLHRMFEAYCGKSPGAYILQERMLKAASLLLQADANSSEVAYQVGYNSLSYFIRQFKAFHQCTPGDYKRKFG